MLVALLFVLALGVVLLAVAVLAMRRQLRIGRASLEPVGVQPAGRARASEPAPIVSAPSLAGDTVTIGGVSRDPRPLLLLFVEARSALCDAVVADAVELCGHAGVRLLLLGEGRTQDYRAMLEACGLGEMDIILNAAMGEEFAIGTVPSAALIDAEGHIVERGTVQRREQLEMLLDCAKALPREVMPDAGSNLSRLDDLRAALAASGALK